MDTLEAMQKRASCRKYKDKDLDKEYLSVVLEAGRLAPSTGNLQDRSFIIVRNKGTRMRIAEACAGQMWMQFAPIHIVVVAENRRTKQFYGIRGERVYAIEDCAFSVQNMLLAATELDIGACTVSAFDEDKIKGILSIQDPARPIAVITLGHYVEKPKQTPKYAIEKLAWLDKWGNKMGNIPISLDVWSEIIANKAKEIKEKSKIEEKSEALVSKLKKHGKKLKERILRK